MRLFILYLLLIATVLPTVSSWGIIAHYQLNKEYIARVLCENRDRPELHCDGNCYLAKRLKAQQDKQDKETTERVQSIPVIQLFCETPALFTFWPVRRLSAEWTSVYLLKPYVAPLVRILQPPRA